MPVYLSSRCKISVGTTSMSQGHDLKFPVTGVGVQQKTRTPTATCRQKIELKVTGRTGYRGMNYSQGRPDGGCTGWLSQRARYKYYSHYYSDTTTIMTAVK